MHLDPGGAVLTHQISVDPTPTPSCWADTRVMVKELLPIVLRISVRTPGGQGSAIACHCDNAAVVAIVSSGRSKMEAASHAPWEVPGIFSGIFIFFQQ